MIFDRFVWHETFMTFGQMGFIRLVPPTQAPPTTPSKALVTLTEQITRRLGAKLVGSRAVFDCGIVYLGVTEMAIKLAGVGYFFVKDGGQNVEALVPKELDRAEQSRRYRELQKWRSAIFGDASAPA